MKMKRTLLSIAVLFLLASTACKKKEAGSTSGAWTFGADIYSAETVTNKVSTFDYWMIAKDDNASSPHMLTFFFNTTSTPNAITPTPGTYKVVQTVTNAWQMSFSVNGSSASKIYSSMGNDNISATVSVAGDKVSIHMPKAWATVDGSDSVQVSAEVTKN